MQYREYQVEDFLADQFFVKWVKNPGPETSKFWENWIKNNPEKLDTINQARHIITSIEPKNFYSATKEDSDEVLERIFKQSNEIVQFGYRKKSDRYTRWFRYAALFIVLLCLGGILAYFSHNRVDLDQSQLVARENPAGQKSTFKLSDGTIIKLNAESKLIFLENFNDHERKVFLEGEAFFNVSRDESRPFVVETRELSTTVLGTSFNIRSYDDDPKKQVAVVSGKVKVEIISKSANPQDGIQEILVKNQMVSYNPSVKKLNKTTGIPDRILAWQDNTIKFEHTDFEEVQKTLARWYGVEFEIKTDDTFEGGFVGTYHDEFLENVLKGLKKQYEKEFEYEIKDKKVIIY